MPKRGRRPHMVLLSKKMDSSVPTDQVSLLPDTESSVSGILPAAELLQILDSELDTAALAHSRRQPIYRSVKRLSKMIGGEYGNRVIYELLQNAHDAQPDGNGKVLVHLIVRSPGDGELLVANAGTGFTRDNLDAIRNIASSTKEIGEGIGNKGVGFRSVEAFTEDPRIYSCRGPARPRESFDGYSFRLASQVEVEERLKHLGKAKSAAAVAAAMPRYLAAVPVESQPAHVKALAREGYATVVSLRLTSADTINLALQQLQQLVNAEAPVLLFLERIGALEIRSTGAPTMKPSVVLTRKSVPLALEQSGEVSSRFQIVTLGPDPIKWLMARRTLDMSKVLEAVTRSISLEKHLESWLNWQGEAVVSCAVPLDGDGLHKGRLYNFLPMSADSRSPFQGHLDAPFYTSINRERARLELPLNSYLLNIAAAVCAEAALALRLKPELPSRCVVDFAAWSSSESARIKAGFEASGIQIMLAEVWPTTAASWKAFGEVASWPLGSFKVFTASRATKAGAAEIISNRLAPDRIAAVDALARAFGTSCEPTEQTLAEWAERIAGALPPSPKDDRWGKLYTDLVQAFGPHRLNALVGRKILLDRNSTLVAAGKDVYARHEGGKRRKGEGAPLPPAALARKLTILADEITVRDTAVPFERASLWRPYDATEILSNLPSLFTDRPADSRREAALLWAFEVWRHDAAGATRVLSAADVHVPTRTGWASARSASFSQTWTEAGVDLDFYLAESGATSAECAEAAKTLLVDVPAWPGDAKGHKQEWIRFLSAAGVSDGLIPVAAKVPDGPLTGGNWSYYLRTGRYPELNAAWYLHARFVEPSFPQTSYWRRGEAWKLPGQAIVANLPDDARRRFATLAIRHLQTHGKKYTRFSLWRREREHRHQNEVTFYTPLATFLTTAAWFPMETPGKLEFVPIAMGWLVTERRSEPKFVPQAPEEIASLLSKDDSTIKTLAADPFHLKVWKAQESAPGRLQALAQVCESVSQPERATLRRLYELAWKDLLELNLDLVRDAALICERPGAFGKVVGAIPPAGIYLRDTGTNELSRLLVDTGSAVLAVSFDHIPVGLQAKIDATGKFKSLRVDEASVGILVDGEPFNSPLGTSPLLDAVPWLGEALQLGHEFGASGFERNVNMAQVLERLRRLRLHEADSILMSSPGGPSQAMDRFLHRDESRPTLLVKGRFDSNQLVETAKVLSNYLHPNLHSFETFLVRLVYRLGNDRDLRTLVPSEVHYAAAAQTHIETVRDYLASVRHDDSSRIDALLPLLAYFIGAEAAQVMGARLMDERMSKWAAIIATALPAQDVERMLAATEKSFNLLALMRELGLQYARLNLANMALGRPSLVSETDLRRQFEVFKNEFRPVLLDRLRGHFQPKFDDPEAFAPYEEMRDLEFITYDDAWSTSKEAIERDDVMALASAALSGFTPQDAGGKLASLDALRLGNRKVVAKVAELAKAVFEAANVQSLNEAWSGGASEVAAVLDGTGLLDFHAVGEQESLALLARAGLWPGGTPLSLNLADHGLTQDDLDRERKRAHAKQAEEKRRLNLVTFGGTEFDTSDAQFARRFAEAASEAFASGGWELRSNRRLANLAAQPERDPTAKRGGGGGSSKPIQRLPEPVRGAIGLAGELLAFRYLEAKHPKIFTDACWVSENRVSLFPDKGSMRWGYDFKVPTSERDWLYEVKATPGDLCEFELTDNEYRQAVAAAPDKSRRYRILFVLHALDPSRCRVVELPNPASEANGSLFRIIGRSSTRMRFEIEQAGRRS